MNGNGVTSTTSGNINTISIPAIAQHGTSRLAPGGAELNLLPANSNGNGAVYRNQSKLIMKGELLASTAFETSTTRLTNETRRFFSSETSNTSRVHVMQSTPTIVVSQPQNINIIASSPQLASKV